VILEGVVSLYANDADLLAIIGTSDTRGDSTNGIFPLLMPTATPMPALVYARVAGHEIDTMDGRGELKVMRLQTSAYAESGKDAINTAEAAKKVIVGFRGVLSDGTEVDNVILLLDLDHYEPVLKLYHSHFDVEIWYRNAT
jgi:hypothetical protein